MKTIQQTLLLVILLFSGIAMQAQNWFTAGNTAINPAIEMLGTTDNTPIPFRTNNAERMRLYQSQTSTINGFTVDQTGYLLLSREPVLFNTLGPFSMLHLGGVQGSMELSFRDWMKDGMTITGNGDAMYMGLRAMPDVQDETETVIAWGDNASQGAFGADNLVFRFTRAYNPISTNEVNPSSYTGLQIMRLSAEGNRGRVGIGSNFDNGALQPQRKLHVMDAGVNVTNNQLRLAFDFDYFADFRVNNDGHLSIHPRANEFEFMNVGINTYDPTHTLDVNGDGRFRELPNNAADVLITGVEQSAVGDYTLNYLSFNGQNDQFLAGDGTWQSISNTGVDCDWLEVGGTDIVTGLPGSACPIEGAVSIGTTGTLGKFNTAWNPAQQPQYTANFDQRIDGTGNSSSIVHATYTQVNGSWGNAFGHEIRMGSGQTLEATAFKTRLRANIVAIGGDFDLFLAKLQYGVRAVVRPEECLHDAYAVYGRVNAVNQCSNPPSNHWAGYFEGDVFTSGQAFGFSDENLKTDILELQNPLEIISNLTPSSYQFAHEAHPEINLPKGEQFGFIAQNVLEVLPFAVKEINLPEVYDEEGELVRETATYLGVNYDHIIPINTAAIQEQQGIIQNQQNQINELQSTVNELMALVESCCAQMDDAKSNTPGNDIRLNQEKTELKQNRPNPFDISTTIDYSLAEGGEVALAVYNDKGQLVAQLDQGLKASGSYSVLWNASNISQGVYYYSLKVNGVELVKKAVKL